MMLQQIKIEEIYDKNINFLIGSGASFGLLPTLALKIKDAGGTSQTIETLATKFEAENKIDQNTLLFMHYYKECIEPAMKLDAGSLNPAQIEVMSNYELFLRTLISIMNRSKSSSKTINLFTTNYDNCFEVAADKLYARESVNFILNDGTRGFKTKHLHSRYFNSCVYQTGVFDQHRVDVSQLNLVHLHGSIYWKKHNETIVVDYGQDNAPLLDPSLLTSIGGFSAYLNSDTATLNDLDTFSVDPGVKDMFWDQYKLIPVVNPTKWKFYETVFEEHYYQMLRLLSYELEKPNTILISFGFSFADEHILHLIQRSLSNPKLQLFVCCFDTNECNKMRERFREYGNVSYVGFDTDGLDFNRFNSEVFKLSPSGAGTS